MVVIFTDHYNLTNLFLIPNAISLKNRKKEFVFFFFCKRKISRMKQQKRPVAMVLVSWFRRQPRKKKLFVSVLSAIIGLAFIQTAVVDRNKLFIASEAIHALGICLLIYKIKKEKSCAGIINYFFSLFLFNFFTYTKNP